MIAQDFLFDDFLLTLPILLLSGMGLLPVLLDALQDKGKRRNNSVGPYILVCLGISLFSHNLLRPAESRFAFNEELLFDSLSYSLVNIVLIAALFFSGLLYYRSEQYGHRASTVCFLFLNAVSGIVFSLVSNSLVLCLLGAELFVICFCFLIALSQRLPKESEGLVKLIAFQSIASAFIVFGLSFFFASLGSLKIHSISEMSYELIEHDKVFLLGMSLCVVGVAIKLGIFPVNAWLPDVVQGFSFSLSSFFVLMTKIVFSSFLLRILLVQPLTGDNIFFSVLQWLAIGTALSAILSVVRQKSFKRVVGFLFAFEVSFLVMGFVVTGISDIAVGNINSLVVYLCSSCLTVFVLLLVLEDESGDIATKQLYSAIQKQPKKRLLVTLFLLQIAGAPLSVAFFAKLNIYKDMLSEGLLWMAFWAGIGMALATYLVFTIVSSLYSENLEPEAN